MATRQEIVAAITSIIQDKAFDETVIIAKMNNAVSRIAAGIRMPNGEVSPPLPDLYTYDTVVTVTTGSSVSLPANYQRKVFQIYDDTGNKILPPNGGDYYSFSLFMRQVNNMNLAEAGEVYRVCVKGTKLLYQGIPSAAYTLGIHYYRKPVDMATDDAPPDGIPEHLQLDLVKHYVLMNLYGEAIEDGQDNRGIGTKYHAERFFSTMVDLIDFIGRDEEPVYYGQESGEDRGICD